MKIVAISGADGSGKSTFANVLEASLHEAGIGPTARLWLRWNPRALRGRSDVTSTVDPRHRGHPVKRAAKTIGLGRVWIAAATKSYAAQLAFQLGSVPTETQVLIADRFVVDFVADLVAGNLLSVAEAPEIAARLPRPDVGVILSVPGDVLLSRREIADDPSALLARDALYRELAPGLGAHLLDAREDSAVEVVTALLDSANA